jgi:hypothetical protein
MFGINKEYHYNCVCTICSSTYLEGVTDVIISMSCYDLVADNNEDTRISDIMLWDIMMVGARAPFHHFIIIGPFIRLYLDDRTVERVFHVFK